MDNLTLVIPAKQEKESLPSVLKELKKYNTHITIVLEESDKETISSIKEFDCNILFQKGKGYGDALIQGINSVKTDYFWIFNADGSFKPDEKLLVISEQGIGDTIQYMRYIPYMRSLHMNLSFCTLTKLHSIIQSSKIDQTPLSPEQAEQVKEGKWISLLSLPRLLRITPSNPIVLEPYISSTSDLKKNWRDKLK